MKKTREPQPARSTAGTSDMQTDAQASYVAMKVFGDEAWKALAGLGPLAPTLDQLKKDYLDEATALWNGLLQPGGALPAPADRRFAARTIRATDTEWRVPHLEQRAQHRRDRVRHAF